MAKSIYNHYMFGYSSDYAGKEVLNAELKGSQEKGEVFPTTGG